MMMEVASMSFNIHADYNGKITKKDLKKVFWRSIPMEHSWNYERMDNVGYAWALYPVLKKIISGSKRFKQGDETSFVTL